MINLPVQTGVPSLPSPSPLVKASVAPRTLIPSEAKLVPPPADIQQSEPTRITISAVGYDAVVGHMVTDANGDVNPPTLQEAYWITDRGVEPGTTADNTVYMACHSWSQGDAPCSRVSQHATAGQHVLVTTANGVLDYLIQDTKLYSKDGEFKNSSEVRAIVPGRLVLVTCYEPPGGGRSTDNFVVYAQLVTGG
jgi:hypothetical protein